MVGFADSDPCAVQNGGLRLVSMQGAAAGITATADYGSQTLTQVSQCNQCVLTDNPFGASATERK